MEDQLLLTLRAARDHLNLGVKLSKQGAYHRRAPDPECLPHYGESRRLLLQVLDQDASNREALLMMSQISEGLMDFQGASNFLNRAFDAGEPRTNKLLKKLALLRENAQEWGDLLLAPDELRDLGKFLMSMHVGTGHRTLELTRSWVTKNTFHDPDEVIASLERRGAFSDFQVLANVVHG